MATKHKYFTRVIHGKTYGVERAFGEVAVTCDALTTWHPDMASAEHALNTIEKLGASA